MFNVMCDTSINIDEYMVNDKPQDYDECNNKEGTNGTGTSKTKNAKRL